MSDSLPDLTVRALVTRLSTSAPVPGGGSAAAVAGALGAGLVSMVVSLTTGRPAAADHEATLADIEGAARPLRDELLELAETDAAAYASLAAARRLPRATDAERAERNRQIAVAARSATLSPLLTARAAAAVIGLAEALAPIANRSAVSDVGVAAMLAEAALRGAGMNVTINLPSLADDDPVRVRATGEIAELLADLDARAATLRTSVAERVG